jgi:hypothetical protein
VTLIEAIEASTLAEHLRQSRWTYPLVNAGHIAGIGMLFGAVVPMAVTTLRGGADARSLVHTLRPFAVAGLTLAIVCGSLLFTAQASDYVENRWFLGKMALIGLAVTNAMLHLKRNLTAGAALASVVLWGGALIAGRMIGFS